MKWKASLRQWREERDITEPKGLGVIPVLQEELDELLQAIKDNDENYIIDSLCDLIVVSANELETYGYDLDLSMKETCKEISSRQQDPEQQQRWAQGNKSPGEKWLKDKNQQGVYVANYKHCKQ